MTSHQFFEQPQSGFKGRTSAEIVRYPKRWALAAMAGAVLFSTAAVATTKLSRIQTAETVSTHSLSANVGLRQFGDSFAEVLW